MTDIYVPGELEILSETEPVLFEALSLIEGLRRIGVEHGERSIVVKPVVGRATRASAGRCLLPERTSEGALSLFVRVSTEFVGQVWTGTVGALPWPESELDGRWDKAMRVWNRTPDRETEPLWQRSRARRVLSDLETIMRQKGFVSSMSEEASARLVRRLLS
jgi:hypothetical protein